MKGKRLVSLVKGKNRKENILNALGLIKKDLVSFQKAKTVLIKPNFTSAYNPTASTQAVAVEAILEFFQEFDPNFGKKRIVIAESSGEAYIRGEPMEKVFSRFGFEKIFAKYPNVKFWDLNKSRRFVSVFYHYPPRMVARRDSSEVKLLVTKVRIPQKIFKFDYKISVSIPKTHDTVIFSGGVKNFLMGIIKQENKGLMHGLVGMKPSLGLPTKILNRLMSLVLQKAPWRFLLWANIYGPNCLKDNLYGFNKENFIRSVICLHKNLVKVGRLIMPDLVVLDGWWGMERDGPVYGRRRNLRIAIAATDPVVADAVGAKVIGFNPEKIAYLRLLAKASKGKLSFKNLVGEKIAAVAQKFQPHRHFRHQLKGVKILTKDD